MARWKHLLLFLVLPYLLPSSGFAQWLPDGNPVCTDPSVQRWQRMVLDGNGNSIIVWSDSRNGFSYDIYAQRLDPDGNPLWTIDGEQLSTTDDDLSLQGVIDDGSSGVFIVRNYRPNWTHGNIWAQHVNSSGTILWTTPVQTSPAAEQALDWDPYIVPDGAGGVIVIWRFDNLNGDQYDRIKAQRIDASGARLWGDYTNGIAIDYNAETENALSVCPDGAGGAYVAWEQENTYSERVIVVKRLRNDETFHFGEIIVSDEQEHYCNSPIIVPDGYGGVYVSWAESPNWPRDHRVQRLDGDGNELWQAGGIETKNFTSWIRSEGSLIGVYEYYGDLYAQRVLLTGTIFWEDVRICADGYWDDPVVMTSDGSGGAVIAWEDTRSVDRDIYMQHIDGMGNTLWPADGMPVCTAAGNQTFPKIEYVGTDEGWLLSWMNGYDIYAGRVLEGLCEVEPIEIDFGAVEVGSTKDTTFTLMNTGETTLSGSVSESCDHYSIIDGGGPYSLAYGQSLVVTVRFEPAAHGTHLCTIETGDDFCHDVTCKGVGTVCPPGNVYYVDADAAGNADGSSWANAFNELGEALASAAVCSGVTEIWVAEGVYKAVGPFGRYETFRLQSGLAVYGGFGGTETSLSERDWIAHTTVLSGDIGVERERILANNYDNCYNVVTGSGADPTAVLDGFEITDGMADGPGTYLSSGGGIVISSGSPTLSNLKIHNNHAVYRGGAVYVTGGGPTLTNTVISGNYSDEDGGGIFSEGADPVLINVVVRENLSQVSGGGCALAWGNPVLINCTVLNNTCVEWPGSGGLLVFSCEPTIVNSIVWGNTEPEIVNLYGGSSLISHSIVRGCGGSGAGWVSSMGIDGGNNLDEDPKFKTTYTSAPPWEVWSTSPAINAGDNTAVPAGVTTDISWNPRIYGGTVDMGAYEHQGVVTDAGDVPGVPDAYALRQNVPNPFNPVTTIAFDLPKAGHVRLDVYNVKGERVANLVDGRMTAGRKEIGWEARDGSGNPLSSGVYFYRLVAGEFVQTRKMILLR